MNTILASCGRCGYPIEAILGESVKYCPYCNVKTRLRVSQLPNILTNPFGILLFGVAAFSVGYALGQRRK